MNFRVIVSTMTLAGLAGCGDSTPTGPQFQVSFTNHLRNPITVSGSGVQTTTVSGSGAVVFPGGSLTATITEADETYGDGSPVPDDLNAFSVPVAPGATITITNVIGSTTYFAPYVTNPMTTPVAVAIVHSGTLRCLGSQSGNTTDVRWGYYQLEPTAEFRYYSGTECKGSYRFWTASQIQGSLFVSGSVFLTTDTPP